LDLEEARHHFVAAGTEIFPDDKPIAGWSRFYVRDPGGNRIEVAQAK
jgi:predicted enzyme related to lactoylglutathione lyase